MKTEQLIVNTLFQLKVPDKAYSWIVAQSAHETATRKGAFTSNVLKQNNNLFGMKMPKRRKTTAIAAGTSAPASEGKTPYAKYASLQDSVKDLDLWLKYNKINWDKVNTEAEYAAFLFKKGYYGVTLEEYLKGLKFWISKIKIPKPVIIGLPIILIGLLALYIASK